MLPEDFQVNNNTTTATECNNTSQKTISKSESCISKPPLDVAAVHLKMDGKKKLLTHHRNLSLDLGQMGLLQGFSMHQRNRSLDSIRSLDSALCKIPESELEYSGSPPTSMQAHSLSSVRLQDSCSPSLKPVLSAMTQDIRTQLRTNINQINRTVNKTDKVVVTETFVAPDSEKNDVVSSEIKRQYRTSLNSVDSGISGCDRKCSCGSGKCKQCSVRRSNSNCSSERDETRSYDSQLDVKSLDSCDITRAAHIKKKNDNESWLLRLFKSKHFDMSMACSYLFKSKEVGVQQFIGNKLFDFKPREVDFYLPQLLTMYINMYDIAQALHPYIVARCKNSSDFSLQVAWLLDSYTDQSVPSKKRAHNTKLLKLILTEELFGTNRNQFSFNLPTEIVQNHKHKTHVRSRSDVVTTPQKPTSHPVFPNSQKINLGDIGSGMAFNNGCTCFTNNRGVYSDLMGESITCSCAAPKLAAQNEFMKALVGLGKLLSTYPNKEQRYERLLVEINSLNANLPARVWLPLYSDRCQHHAVRISPQLATILNSKDKAPYLLYVEVLKVSDVDTSPVHPKICHSLRYTRSEENLAMVEDSTDEEVEEEIQIMQYHHMKKSMTLDTISQMSQDSSISNGSNEPMFINAVDVYKRLTEGVCESSAGFKRDPDDPSASILKEPWEAKKERARELSPYGHLPNWDLMSVIVKCNDDLRQELLAYQVQVLFQQIWKEEMAACSLWLRPYRILVLSKDCGLIEPVVDTVSLHQVKKHSKLTLLQYFEEEFGPQTSESFLTAQRNFVESCAAYCLLCYILQVKDRHNGNILVDSEGHIVHIDYGYMLSASPKNIGFESSPFKLNQEFCDVMGGMNSDLFQYFKILMMKGLLALRKHCDKILSIVEIARQGPHLPCFRGGASVMTNLQSRFHSTLTDAQLQLLIDQLVESSIHSFSTSLYDTFQYYSNGIL